jgi:hypothetical protein
LCGNFSLKLLLRLTALKSCCLVSQDFCGRASAVYASGSKTSPSSPENVVLLALKALLL